MDNIDQTIADDLLNIQAIPNQKMMALNNLISIVYHKDMQLSSLLNDLGFSDAQIQIIETGYLNQTAQIIQEILKEFIFVRLDAERLWLILSKCYGLTDESPKTLKVLASELNISGEKVHRLEEKAIRKLNIARKKNLLQFRLKSKLSELLETLPEELPASNLALEKQESRINPSAAKIPEYVLIQRKVYPRAYEPWTEEEQRFLEVLLKQGKTVKQLAELFQRNSGAISSRLRKMGLLP